MATEVYNWVQKYDADLDDRQVRGGHPGNQTGMVSASGVNYSHWGDSVQLE